MYVSQTNRLRGLSAQEYAFLRDLCHEAGLLRNVALFETRQHFFETGGVLPYVDCYRRVKGNEHFKMLQYHVAQQVVRQVTRDMTGFLNKRAKHSGDDSIRLPRYMRGEKLWFVTIAVEHVCASREVKVPVSHAYAKARGDLGLRLELPERVDAESLKEVRICPVASGLGFEVAFISEVDDVEVSGRPDVCGCDIGVDNLATLVASDGTSTIVDGRRLKSYNHRYNKRIAELRSAQSKTKGFTKDTPHTKLMRRLMYKRRRFMRDYMRKAAKFVCDWCVAHDVGEVVIGRNVGFKHEVSMGKVSNQNFVSIPYGMFYTALESKCAQYGIVYTQTEESYTSKASFLDGDDVPTYGKTISSAKAFSGRRVKRGLYRTRLGRLVNADVNGACNIVLKGKRNLEPEVFQGLCEGLLAGPVRHRIV